MKLLILGGNNFIGAELVKQALKAGHDVHVLSLIKPQGSTVTWHNINRNDIPALSKLFKEHSFDTVIDNIAFNGWQVEALFQVSVGRFQKYVLTSTVEIYHNSSALLATEADELFVPRVTVPKQDESNYRRGKRACEVALSAISHVQWSVARPSMVVGPNDHLTGSARGRLAYGRSMFYPARILDNQPILLQDNDYKNFSIVWYADVAKALLLLAEHRPELDRQAFNVSGAIIGNRKLLRALSPTTNVVRAAEEKLVAIDYAFPYVIPTSPWWMLIDSSKLKQHGWTPTPVEDFAPKLMKAKKATSVAALIKPARAAELSLASELAEEPLTPDTLSSTPSILGIGTYLGEATPECDAAYEAALLEAQRLGITTIDTAANYRNGMSERLIGRLLLDGRLNRQTTFVITKGGYANSDLALHLAEHERKHHHSVRAAYIMKSLRASVKNLGAAPSCYLVHNPDTALKYMTAEQLYAALTITFTALEEAVSDGLIASYGVAVWHAFTNGALSIERLVKCAEIAAGESLHNFKGVELPYNTLDSLTSTYRCQAVNGELFTPLEAARKLNLQTFTSFTVRRGSEAAPMLIANSVAHPHVTTALIGMRQAMHVREAAKAI